MYLKLIYPDQSAVFVPDPSSFTVPVYAEQDVASFALNVELVITVNG